MVRRRRSLSRRRRTGRSNSRIRRKPSLRKSHQSSRIVRHPSWLARVTRRSKRRRW
jgi:hypothetical protein